MVRRILRLLHTEMSSVHQAAYVLAALTLSTQLLALVRDRLLAHAFGASRELDLYFASFRVPDLLFVVFASALSVYVLLPFVADRVKDGALDRGCAFLSRIFSLFAIGYTALAVGIFICMPQIASLIFSGFSVADQGQVVLLTRILLFQPLLLGISGIFAVVTQLNRRFVVFALSPLLYNIGIITGVLFFYPIFGVVGLAFGVLLGALLHLGVQVPSLIVSGLMPYPTIRFSWKEFVEIVRAALPRATILSMQQVTLVILVHSATMMTVGSIMVFQFAYNLQAVPIALIGASYATAAFPFLTKLYTEGKYTVFAEQITGAVRHIMFWGFPLLGLIIVLRAHIVRVVLGSGAFDWNTTQLTAAVLALFAVALIAQMIYLLLVRAYYAASSLRAPLIATVLGTAVTAIVAYTLPAYVQSHQSVAMMIHIFFRVEGVSGTEVLSLPIAFTVGALVSVGILSLDSLYRFKLPFVSILAGAIRGVIAAGIAATAAYIALHVAAIQFDTHTSFVGVLGQGLFGGIVGGIAAVGVYYLTRAPELNEMYRAFHRRFRGKAILAIDTEPRD